LIGTERGGLKRPWKNRKRREIRMKAVAFNGSPRKDGNTTILIQHLFRELENEGVKTELVQLSGSEIRGCIACFKCVENKDRRCAVNNDVVNECIEKMVEADGIILGSPTYFADVTAEMKALIDRAGFVSRANGGMYKNKIGLGVIAVRRAGAFHAFDTINHFLLGSQMIVPGRCIVFGAQKGEVEKDEEGMKGLQELGQRMAWLLKKLYG